MSWTAACGDCGRSFGRDKIKGGRCGDCRAPTPQAATVPAPPEPIERAPTSIAPEPTSAPQPARVVAAPAAVNLDWRERALSAGAEIASLRLRLADEERRGLRLEREIAALTARLRTAELRVAGLTREDRPSPRARASRACADCGSAYVPPADAPGRVRCPACASLAVSA